MFRPKFLAALITGAALSMAAGAASAGDHDIFVFVGQSNTAGRTPLQAGDYNPAPNADLLNPSGGWTEASNLDVPDPNFALPPDYYGFNRYSNVEKAPDPARGKKFPQFYNQGLAFATTLAELTTTNRLGLIFNARGATTITEWQKNAPGVDAGWPAGQNLYSRTMTRVQQAKLASASGSNTVKALVIDLGLSDALVGSTPKTPDAWLGQMQAFVRDFRADVGDPNLPVFVAQQPYLSPTVYQTIYPQGVETIYRYNAALAQWAGQDPTVHVVRSDGTTMLATTPPDSAHYDHQSMTWMGQRYARAVAQYVYGHPPTTAAEKMAAAFHPTQKCSLNLAGYPCGAEYHIKTPDWTLSEDVVVLPHRGLWGFGGVISLPENSSPGFQAAIQNGYHMSEVDFTPTATQNSLSSDPSIMAGVMSHDYILYRVTTYPQNTNPAQQDPKFYNLPLNDVVCCGKGITLRDRLGARTSYSVTKQTETADWFKSGLMITIGDIKQTESQGDAFALNWVKQAASVMYDYKNIDYLYGLSFKTSYSPDFIYNNLPADLQADFDKVLWIPQVATDAFYQTSTKPVGMGNQQWINSSADYVTAWLSHYSSILYFEVNYKNPDDSRLKPLHPNDLNYNGSVITYVNVLDYVKQVAGYRGGGFSEEPISTHGNVNRTGRWDIKNADLDTRGDPLFEAYNQTWGNFGVFTTDRPDVWQSMKCQMFNHC